MAFVDLYSELAGRLPGLSPFLAEKFIQRAWRQVRDRRNWSFLQEVCSIYCPTQVTAGTVAITQFQDTVTCNAAASAALLAVTLPAGEDLTALQIRFGGYNNTQFVGQVYNIVAVNQDVPTAIVLTLDRAVVQPTNATSGYQVYRCYVRPPVDDFLKWTGFVDMTNGWDLKIDQTSKFFDKRDPQRMAQGLSFYVGAFKGNPGSQPRPQYELWPHPVQGQTFFCRYQRSGEDFSEETETQAPLIPDELIMARALAFEAYPWAEAAKGQFPQLQKTNWISLMLAEKEHYKTVLQTAMLKDDEQELRSVWSRGHGLIHSGRFKGMKGMVDFPIDSNFMQSHLINF